MEQNKYVIGLDYGTQSGRAILVNVTTGQVVAQAVKEYSHGVMDEVLPDGITKLGVDWALQHPRDYLEVIEQTIPFLLRKAHITGNEVIGLSSDFTACSILPVDLKGVPLCFYEEFKAEPHAYLKLWKHHAAQKEASQLTALAVERAEAFLPRYGGKISSEWLEPKVIQVYNEAPGIYAQANKFIEAGDWINLVLTGEEKRSSCYAGYKGMWNKKEGYPSKAFFKAIDPELENIVEEKLSADIYSLGGKAGELNKEWAEKTGLQVGTAVGISIIDAHAGLPGIGITKPGQMLMIMGTSTCHILLGKEEKIVPGMCGVVEDGVIPGYFAYEAGQACVGDHFEWYVENCVPELYQKEAKEKGVGIHSLLTEKANELKVGESGLLALDWWNGNRTPLVDYDLTGLMAGFSLSTKPEEIYRALIEATAYGTNLVIETFENAGVPVEALYACGGISEKNSMMMQIYADVTNREIRLSESDQTPALGAAMFAAVAAGKEKGGYDSISEAAEAIGKVKDVFYQPIPENVAVYKALYKEYKGLCTYFGAGENDVMKRLKALKLKIKNTEKS